jgi:hypothetical protein
MSDYSPFNDLLYRIYPADPKVSIEKLNADDLERVSKYGSHHPGYVFCNTEFAEVPIMFNKIIHGFECGTYTQNQLRDKIVELSDGIKNYNADDDDDVDVCDYAASMQVYAWALRRLAMRDAYCDTDLVITFKFKK